MNYPEIEKINLFIHSRFYYTYDDPKHDEWKSHAKQLINIPGYKIYDDCDGLASTTVHYFNIQGVKNGWRILASMDGGSQIDHMVAMVQDDAGQRWVVGDTGTSYPVKLQRYSGRMFKFNNIEDGVNWRDNPKEI